MVLVVLAATLALRAVAAADDYRPALNQPDPPLGRVNPVIGEAPPRLSRRVIVVIIDGLRLRDSYGYPWLDSLRRIGIDAAALSHYPTYSRPNHVTILTGVPPTWSGVRNNAYSAPVRIDSLMDRANAAGLDSAYVADVGFGAAFMFHSDWTAAHYVPWPGGFAKAAHLVLEQDYPLVVLLPGAVDVAGHAYGGASPEYRAAAAQVDRDLSAAFDAVDLTRDTVIVTADHGHTDAGGHGGTEPDVLEVPLVMAGAGIRPGAVLGWSHLIDVAPTAAALLGLPAPGHALGQTLDQALILPPEARARLEQADRARILRNRTVVDEVRERAGPRMLRSRTVRVVAVAVLGLLALVVLLAARKAGALHIDWRVLIIAVPAFPLTYYALLDLLGQHFSLSAIPDRADAMGELFHFGLVSTVVQVLAGWVALRGRVVLRDRLAAANALTACGMVVACLPAGIMWALFGPHTFVEPPGSTITVLVPATYVAVACHALAVAVTLGLEFVVFFARAVDPRVRLRRLERAAERERRRLKRDTGEI